MRCARGSRRWRTRRCTRTLPEGICLIVSSTTVRSSRRIRKSNATHGAASGRSSNGRWLFTRSVFSTHNPELHPTHSQRSRRGAEMAARSVTVARVGDIKPGELGAVEIEGTRIALANADGRFYAFGDTCTHEECSLAEGVL